MGLKLDGWKKNKVVDGQLKSDQNGIEI